MNIDTDEARMALTLAPVRGDSPATRRFPSPGLTAGRKASNPPPTTNTEGNMIYNGIRLIPAQDFSAHKDMDKPAPPLLINGKQAYALPGGGYIVL